MNDVKKNMIDSIMEADFVLVGLGGELKAKLSDIERDSRYLDILNRIKAKEEYHWIIPYVECVYLSEHRDTGVKAAYTNLEKMLEGKNYYIVSTCMDDYIYDTGLERDRIVTPCGGYRFVQCTDNCSGTVTKTDMHIFNQIKSCIEGKEEAEDLLGRIEKPVCESCNKDMTFNKIEAEHYAEEGYMERWKHYTEWLQGTVNRKLCVIELGVGMQYPTVIRWPFEKIVFFNQKSSFFRINSKLYQMTEEIKERGHSIKENSTDFLINWFV